MKNKSVLSIAIIIILLVMLVTTAVLADNAIISESLSNVLGSILTVLVFIACFYAGKIDYEISVFECRKCGHTFKPTKAEYTWGVHTTNTRYLRCPDCGEKSWCKRRKTDTEN